jgi:CBS domain containing-hemolysin-like protein
MGAAGDTSRPDVPREVALAMQRAADFSRLTARRVMIPRTQIVAVRAEATLQDLVAFVHGHPHSRYPIYDRTLDDIVGVISAKQLISALVATSNGTEAFDLRAHLSLPLFVPDDVEPLREEIQWLADGSARVNGLALLSDLEAKLPIRLQASEFNTLGGYLFGQLDRVPHVGDEIHVSGHRLTVAEVDGLRIAWIHIRPDADDLIEQLSTPRLVPPAS